MESVLFKIFSEYTIQSGTFQTNLMRSSRLSDLCTDSGLFSAEESRQAVQSLGRWLSFEEFCDSLQVLARARFPVGPDSEVISTLLEEFMEPLSRQISHNWSTVDPKDLNLPNAVIRISHSLFQSFKKIYMKEFPWEITTEQPMSKTFTLSLRKMEKLLALFEVFPDDISKVTVHGLWRDVVVMPDSKVQGLLASALVPKPHKDIGRALSLSKFILLCYFCSVYGHFDREQTPSQKFLEFIDKVKFAISGKIEYHGIKMTLPNKLRSLGTNIRENNNPLFSPKQKVTLALHPVYEDKRKDGTLVQKNTNPEVEEILGKLNGKSARKVMFMLSKVILPLFKHYSDTDFFLSYRSFVQFCRDFEISSQTVSFKYLKEVFDSVLYLNDEETTVDVLPENSLTALDFPKFMKILAVLAYHDNSENTLEEKLCYFALKLGISRGLSRVNKTQGFLKEYQTEIYKIQQLLKI